MGGKKGKSGRCRQYNDEYHKVARKLALEYYYKHREERRKYMKEYHEKNVYALKLSDKLEVSIPKAREILKQTPDLKELFRPNPKKEVAEEKLEQIRQQLKKSEQK